MQRRLRVVAALAGLAFALAGAQPMLRADEKSSVEQIRKELLQLPYYGVFDFLAFSYEKGTVTLMGYAYHSTLRDDAVRATKRASGVDQVIEKISAEHLSLQPRARPMSPVTTNLNVVERETIEQVMRECARNKSQAAKRLGPSRTQLYVRPRKYDLVMAPVVS